MFVDGPMERRTGADCRPTEDRAPSSGLQVNDGELEATEAYAVRKGLILDGHAALGTACLRGCGGSVASDGYAEDSRVTAMMRGSSTRVRGVNDSALAMAEGEQEVTAGHAGAD
eukprot:4606334-Pyramimonas_sp.AAC.1